MLRFRREASTLLTHRFSQALCYAAELHQNQVRKGTPVPYLAHLLAVASTVLQYGGNEDEAIAALLHDAIEDQGGALTREAIRARFGEAVVEIVEGCSDCDGAPKPPWRARKEAYLARVPGDSPSVRLVALADKLNNAQSILSDYRTRGEAIWAHFRGGKEGTLWYYRALVRAFETAGREPLLEELDRVVTELERSVRHP